MILSKVNQMDKSVKIDADLLKEAQELTGEASEKDAIEHVVKRFVEARRKHQNLFDLAGKIKFHEGYDPRKLRFSRYDPD